MPRYIARIQKEIQTLPFWRDVFAEFIATFILVSVQAALPMQWGNSNLGGPVQVALGMGFIVTTMAWTLGDFGGAHMNPAVTICMTLRRDITIVRALLYISVQCLGSLSGAAFIYIATPANSRGNLAVTSLGDGVTPVQGMFLEAWITAILVITILGSTNKRRKGELYMATVPIGLAVALGIMSAFVSTGASMNPARSLGPAIMMKMWDNHWVYWAGPIMGSCFACCIYYMFDRVDIKTCYEVEESERNNNNIPSKTKEMENTNGKAIDSQPQSFL